MKEKVYSAPKAQIIALDLCSGILDTSYDSSRPAFLDNNSNLEDYSRGEDLF